MNQREKNILILKSHAQSYGHSIWSHFSHQRSPEAHYIFQQACWVGYNTEECVDFLIDHGHGSNVEIHSKHLQYFFAICPGVYQPYTHLWRHVEQRMIEEWDLKRPNGIDFNEKREVRPL